MLNLDVRTIALLLGVVSVIQAIVFALYYAVGARYPGVRLLVFASIANAIGFVLVLLRGVIPDLLSIVVGNWSLLLASVLVVCGVNLFVGRTARAEERLTITLAVAIGIAWLPLTYIYPNIGARTILNSLSAAFAYLLSGWILVRNAPHGLAVSYKFAGTVNLLYAAFSLYRAIITAFSAPPRGVFDQTAQQVLVYVVVLVAIMLWTTGVVAMSTQRLLRDLRTAQASEAALLQKAAREASEREQLFRLTFDQSPIGAALTDFQYRFVRVNPVLCQITGYREDELRALTIAAITHPEDLAVDLDQAQALVAGTVESYMLEKRYIRKDGIPVWVQLTGRLMKSVHGQPLHILRLVEDISARKRAEHALRHRIDELLALNQIAQALATWTDLTSGLASVGPVLCSVFRASSISVWAYEQSDATLVRLIAFDQRTIIETQRLPLAVLTFGRTLLDLDSATVFDLPASDSMVASAGSANQQGEQVLLVPLRARNKLVGLLAVRGEQPNQVYPPSDIALAQTIGGVLGSAIENARLFAQAQSLAAERERRRLANELHDSVSQSLFAARRTAEVLPQLWELDPDEGRQALHDLNRFTTGALAEMRALLIELRPHALAELPLHQALSYLPPILAAKSATFVEADLAPAPLLPANVQLALYRIAQEALNNVGKHAHASCIRLDLQIVPPYHEPEPWQGVITLIIQDNGRGYDRKQPVSGRFGLVSMGERANEIGATLEIESKAESGTHVIVRWQGAVAAPKGVEHERPTPDSDRDRR